MTDFSRRTFVAGLSASAALTARAYADIPGANDHLRVGIIGCGGMANGHMRALNKMRETDNVEIVAVCDLYDKRLNEGVDLTKGKPYKDHRTLLEDKNIDYVLIAVPEHQHSIVTLDAIAAGKHIYCEKPMTRTVEEAKKVVAKVKASNLKMQVGVQGMSDESYAVAHQYIKDGAIGTPVMAQIDYSRNHKGDFWADPAYPIDSSAKPGVNIDWNTWLGHAPKRPYDPDRFFRWRRYWDYSGGIATDLFVHRVTRLIKALGLTFPDKAVATGGKFEFKQSLAEIPDTFNALLDYPEGLTVSLVSSMANDTPVDHVIRGHKATIHFNRKGFVIKPQEYFKDEVKEVVYEKKGAEDITLHHRNLQAAIRKNEPLNCDVNLGYSGVVAAEMTVQSYRKRQYLAWDKTKERIIRA